MDQTVPSAAVTDFVSVTAPKSSSDTRWITRTVALFAIGVFTVSGSQILPALLTRGAGGGPIPREQIVAFLLNIALILFAWRRSAQLRQVSRQRDVAEQRAYQLAYFDEVTGIHNRRWFNELLDGIEIGKSPATALILVDLDRFKKINDLFGHAAGDELLRVIGARIAEACPADAHCVRLGGDEFAVLLQGSWAQKKALTAIADGLIESTNRQIRVGNSQTAIGVSIGIATLDKHCRDGSSLLRRADIAMYEAKRLGRRRWAFFDVAMAMEMDRLDKLEADIREGIASGQFMPFFQPIIDLVSGEVTAFEVLARWKHPTKGILEPSEFIAMAEKTGMISDLSLGVMQEALTIARSWPGRLKIAVNVSPVQFADPLIAQRIMKVLSLTGFPPARLELEIMERSLLEDLDIALSTITSLKNAGISICVDDFGTGYASLTHLPSLPFDRIKIDREFIAAMLDEQKSDALVDALATLGKGLKLPITAEGVEAESLRSRLIDLGCSDAQGWLFGNELSAKEVILGFGSQWAALGLNASETASDTPALARKIAGT
ncbi:MAG TPA: EAL domain-containing protein [Croceibacterium sp.]|nr:EAL domain-containing protein [Croceibacterium sp.]